MLRAVFAAIVVLAFGLATGPASVLAADGTPVPTAPRAAGKAKPRAAAEYSPATVAEPIAVPEPKIQYGCQRIWRCDTMVCEWRRGCHGIYGYMEGPYYTQALAKRQWERHGWPTPSKERAR